MQPIRYVPVHPDGYSICYRGREFGRLWRSDEGGWMLEIDPLGLAAEEWSQRAARRTVRYWIDGDRHRKAFDLYLWWGLSTGAKDL